ncbi:hypothetical protein L5M11_09400 [Shewanella sp. SM87]|uniref:AbiTii domain-containing protein n=1 Tax=Shewanella sp. SM87 TaxID=2912808 RepID=UPI0021D9DAFC|nr:hypothetical protein [Shewanella sp. SM87]MCU8007737.1 hypothetical protein [Shewanella sp. SM87]
MGSLIIELQQNCLDDNLSVTSLARKSLLVAQKLALDDAWIRSELNGYTTSDVPKYRRVGTQLVAKTHHGYIPVKFPQSYGERMSSTILRNSVSELESTLNYPDGYMYLNLPERLQTDFRQLFSNTYEYLARVPLGQISFLLNSVRNQILDFAADLEKQGVLGENMSFNSDERGRAQAMNITFNGNFHGILGDVSQSDITQTFNNGIQGDLGALVEALKNHQVAETDITDLKSAITVDGEVVTKADEYGPEVTSWYKRMLSKAIDGSWQVSIATAGNILSTVLNGFYSAN